MAGYDPELHRRQQTMGDPEQARKGWLVGTEIGPSIVAGAAGGDKRKWRWLLVALVVLALGLFLFLTPWLPGLGAFLLLAGALMLPVVFMKAWLGL